MDGEGANKYAFIIMRSSASYIRIEDFEIKDMRRAFHVNYASSNNSNFYIVGNYIHDTYMSALYFNDAGVNNVTIESNIIASSGVGTSVANLHHGVYGYGTDFEIFNNIFYDHKHGWAIQTTGTSDRWNIFNNTFDNANPDREGHIVVWGNPDDLVIANNIFSEPNANAIYCSGHTTSQVVFKNNLTSSGIGLFYSACDTGLYTQTDNVVGSVSLFTNDAGNDYTLQSGSPAIDAGMSSGAPSTDYDYNSRPSGSGYDIGAYEYVTLNQSSPKAPTGMKIP